MGYDECFSLIKKIETMNKMKILNLYCGMGGNRKNWINCEIVAVEQNEEVADIYKENFPDDIVIIGDAHEYLLIHYNEFDFIWSSRPCQTHSRPRFWASKGGRYPALYPDMVLYQEIIFLKHFFKGQWVVENVTPYYEPLIKPTIKLGRHFFWSNFTIENKSFENKNTRVWAVTSTSKNFGFDISDRKIKHRKDQIIRNLVNPELGLHILNCSKNI